jgi:uncharacterized damage-inducible protein DinB
LLSPSATIAFSLTIGGMDDTRFLELSVHYLGEYLRKIRACVDALPEDRLWWRPNARSNSVGNLLLHLSGNLSQWALAGLGGVAYERHRDAEFAALEGGTRAELLERLARVVEGCQDAIRRLKPADLAARRVIQKHDVDGVEAVYHVVEHTSYHTGQIAWIAKQGDAAIEFYPELKPPGGPA